MRSLQAMNGIVCTKVAGSINDPPQQRFSERDDSASFDDFIDGLVVVAHLIDQMLPPFDVKSKREKSKKKIKRIHFNDLVSVGVFFLLRSGSCQRAHPPTQVSMRVSFLCVFTGPKSFGKELMSSLYENNKLVCRMLSAK